MQMVFMTGVHDEWTKRGESREGQRVEVVQERKASVSAQGDVLLTSRFSCLAGVLMYKGVKYRVRHKKYRKESSRATHQQPLPSFRPIYWHSALPAHTIAPSASTSPRTMLRFPHATISAWVGGALTLTLAVASEAADDSEAAVEVGTTLSVWLALDSIVE
jgi:hypothetical protein